MILLKKKILNGLFLHRNTTAVVILPELLLGGFGRFTFGCLGLLNNLSAHNVFTGQSLIERLTLEGEVSKSSSWSPLADLPRFLGEDLLEAGVAGASLVACIIFFLIMAQALDAERGLLCKKGPGSGKGPAGKERIAMIACTHHSCKVGELLVIDLGWLFEALPRQRHEVSLSIRKVCSTHD